MSRSHVGKHRDKLRQIVAEIKDQSCAICGKRFPSCAMDFHHVNGEKDGGIAVMVSKAYGIEAVLTEINKCMVVCACCHRILHHCREE